MLVIRPYTTPGPPPLYKLPPLSARPSQFENLLDTHANMRDPPPAPQALSLNIPMEQILQNPNVLSISWTWPETLMSSPSTDASVRLSTASGFSFFDSSMAYNQQCWEDMLSRDHSCNDKEKEGRRDMLHVREKMYLPSNKTANKHLLFP